ncbi:unnamed protein product, partial [Mesorhabditis belari]|uniref:Bestrophin homolog n=1 Tax=Mesorhabditis belari TaxID=2138241 RepID=A0AAF3JA09_9BILA
MTVSYNLDVVETSFIGFLKLQLRWRGSIWKSVMRELILFSAAFAFITLVYRSNYVITPETRMIWDNFAALFDMKLDYIPLTFMLGFFVTIIVGRWNEIFNNIGWIDNAALVMSTYLRGSDQPSRMLRRNVVKYMVLTQVLVFRDISMQVRKRFPTLETVVAAGLMTEAEKQKYDEVNFRYNKHFMPIQWAYAILFEARQGGKLSADIMLNEIIKHITEFRTGLARLLNFDWVPIPLVYPQVVFLAVRSYFVLCLIARQSVLIDGEVPKDGNQFYPLVPFFMTALQFVFFVGWMKVAESLMNPLGEDDDDFECNFLIDRNLAMGMVIVDETYNSPPPQEKDAFWLANVDPLYSEETANKPKNPLIGSVAQVEPKTDEVVMMPHLDSEDHQAADNSFDYGDGQKLLPRGISVVSVNRVSDSKTSLNTRQKGFLETVRNRFTRDSSRLSRPNRLVMSRTSLNTPDGLHPPNNYPGSTCTSAIDIVDELAAISERRNTDNLSPEDFSPKSPTRRSPIGDTDTMMPSVPEEDEEHQRTRTSVDLAKWKRMQDEMLKDQNDKDK